MTVTDQRFHPLVEQFNGQTITLAADGWRDHDGVPEHVTIGTQGTWHERMGVETAWSLVTVSCELNRMRHRVAGYIQARLAVGSAMGNVLRDVFQRIHPDADPNKMSIASSHSDNEHHWLLLLIRTTCGR